MRRFGLYLATALFSLHLTGGAAWAQTSIAAVSPVRLVRLHDGSSYNGDLVEQVPEDHITLKLATGVVRRFEWSELAAVTEVATAATAGAVTLPSTPFADPVPPWGLSSIVGAPPVAVRLHTDDQEAALYQQTGTSMVVGATYRGSFTGQVEFWNKVCKAPCEQPLDPSGTYSIRGTNILPSRSFSLPGGGLLNIDVKAGHIGAKVGGLMLAGLGVGAVVTGVVLLITGNQGNTVPSDSFFAQQRSDEAALLSTERTAGGVVLGVGLAALVGGIVTLTQARTTVRIDGQLVAQLPVPRRGPLYVSAQGLRF